MDWLELSKKLKKNWEALAKTDKDLFKGFSVCKQETQLGKYS